MEISLSLKYKQTCDQITYRDTVYAHECEEQPIKVAHFHGICGLHCVRLTLRFLIKFSAYFHNERLGGVFFLLHLI